MCGRSFLSFAKFSVSPIKCTHWAVCMTSSIEKNDSHALPDRFKLKLFSWFWFKWGKMCFFFDMWLMCHDHWTSYNTTVMSQQASRGATATATFSLGGNDNVAINVFPDTMHAENWLTDSLKLHRHSPPNTWQRLCFENTPHSLLWVWPTFVIPR